MVMSICMYAQDGQALFFATVLQFITALCGYNCEYNDEDGTMKTHDY